MQVDQASAFAGRPRFQGREDPRSCVEETDDNGDDSAEPDTPVDTVWQMAGASTAQRLVAIPRTVEEAEDHLEWTKPSLWRNESVEDVTPL